MPSFTIAQFSFQYTIDGSGNLTGLTATDGDSNIYDCSIQLLPREEGKGEGVQCCTPDGICTSGPCSA